jgi:hypothetical protein
MQEGLCLKDALIEWYRLKLTLICGYHEQLVMLVARTAALLGFTDGALE